MPIKIVAVSKADFESWVEQAKEEFARVDEPDRGVRLAEAASPVPASAD
jgi:heme/copper-type cytochrome/quinol oxidase subunit 2